MKIIKLTQGYETIVDDEDYTNLTHSSWYWSSGYARRSKRNPETGRRESELMHRVLMDAKQGEIVDHINGNKLDNRRSNLRKVCNSKNSQNRRTTERAQSGFAGVSPVIRDGITIGFRARIMKDNVQYNLGQYRTDYDAALVYNGAAKVLFGENCRLNTFKKYSRMASKLKRVMRRVLEALL